MTSPAGPRARPALVAIGASWGGAKALGRVLRNLDDRFPLAVAVAQHRGPDGSELALVRYLQARSALPVREVDDKDAIEAGCVHVAPPDYHLLVERGQFSLSIDPKVRHSRPSIDVLFESAAEAYGDAVVAVVLTGANDDGSRGVLRVREQGGLVLVQDPATAERPEMPAAAIASGAADLVLTLEGIAETLCSLGARS